MQQEYKLRLESVDPREELVVIVAHETDREGVETFVWVNGQNFDSYRAKKLFERAATLLSREHQAFEETF